MTHTHQTNETTSHNHHHKGEKDITCQLMPSCVHYRILLPLALLLAPFTSATDPSCLMHFNSHLPARQPS
ncbi:predicted protein [Arabidopsis lyrata subsp. lyrata]|uniref:Predicted protein n=1 Tax=Arabidopsis lyrata subsp. lyrata TaxID=81972 RepID=D7M4Q1_ARALL|nr:predicted protein [Arabidopsis lyrata subsp. lyrata]